MWRRTQAARHLLGNTEQDRGSTGFTPPQPRSEGGITGHDAENTAVKGGSPAMMLRTGSEGEITGHDAINRQ
ncbi:hypothetical protein ACOMHN_009603 [Nucella lapillus]